MASKKVLVLLNLFILIAAQDLETNFDPLEFTEDVDTLDALDPLDPIDPLGQGIENVPKDFLISWHARRALRRILAQMPCGWPEYGVPPLAPYINEDLSIRLDNSVLKTETSLKPLRIDGLDNMEINRLKVGLIFRRVNFDFNFPNITLTGNFDTSTTLNLEEFMASKLFAKGSGELNLSLQNLRISGNLKYKLPIFFGSAKITKVNAKVSLGNVSSELSGDLNGVPIGEKVNDFIVTELLEYLNGHDYLWNGLFEKHVLPLINAQLEGQTLWKIFWWSISRSSESTTCGAGDLNVDMDILELHQLLLKNSKPPTNTIINAENDNQL